MRRFWAFAALVASWSVICAVTGAGEGPIGFLIMLMPVALLAVIVFRDRDED